MCRDVARHCSTDLAFIFVAGVGAGCVGHCKVGVGIQSVCVFPRRVACKDRLEHMGGVKGRILGERFPEEITSRLLPNVH